jgi:antitoxin component of RelBE/YafQ-DinJ toxin-antitoxin module
MNVIDLVLPMPRNGSVQVTVDDQLKQRLEALAASSGLSLSSYVRVLINRHLAALDRQSQALPTLQDFYSNL